MSFKRYILFFIIGIFLVLLLGTFSIAQNTDVSGSYTSDLNQLNIVTAAVSNSSDWQNLAQTWKQEILNNPFVSSADSFLRSVNPVFLFLTGESYDLSLFFYFVILLWIFFIFQFRKILKMSLFSSQWVCWVISIGLSIVLGQMGLYHAISNFFIYLIFLPKTPWIGILIFVGINAGLIFISMIDNMIGKSSKKNKELMEKEKEKTNMKVLDTVVKGIEGGLKK